MPEPKNPSNDGVMRVWQAAYISCSQGNMEAGRLLQEIPLTWKPIRNRSYAGMLGQHQLAYILQHDGQTTWKWMVSGCNGTIRYDFQSADTLEEAKAAVQASIDQWFRRAGLLGADTPSERLSVVFGAA